MRLVKNSGNDRVLDILKSKIIPEATLDVATHELSLFALQELFEQISNCKFSRYILPDPKTFGIGWLGEDSDRVFRNKLLARTLARKAHELFKESVEIRGATTNLPQSLVIVNSPDSSSIAISGSCPLSTSGLGITPSNRFGMIQVTETPEETEMLNSWYEALWKETANNGSIKDVVLSQLQSLVEHRLAQSAYFLSLSNLFSKQSIKDHD